MVYQFSGVLENERKGVGGRGTRTPLDPLDIDSPTLSGSRLSDRGDGAEICNQKKKTSEAYIIIIIIIIIIIVISFTFIFSFFCCKAA